MKILLVQLGAIGDMILATPMIGAIKEKYPDSVVYIFAGKKNYPVIKDDPRAERIFVFDKSPLKFIKIISALRKHKFDYLIDPKDHHSSESAYLARFCRAEKKIGYNKPGSKTFNIGLPGDDDNYELHYTERAYNALAELGIEKPDIIPLPQLFTSPDSEQYLDEFFTGFPNKKFQVINISASRDYKMWQKEKWVEFINAAGNDFNFVLSYAPPEKEDADYILEKCPGVTRFKSRSINDVVSLVKRCSLLITPDTSLVHIAAAFDIPLFCMFNPNEKFFKKFYPLSSRKCIVKAGRGESIRKFTSERIIAAFREFCGKI